jgi:hypothetical protein
LINYETTKIKINSNTITFLLLSNRLAEANTNRKKMSSNPLLPSQSHTHIVSNLRNFRLNGVSPPTPDDDETLGYEVGSEWIIPHPVNEVYICTDATDGFAVWMLVQRGASSAGSSQQIFVAKNGSDTTGDGTQTNPYLTIPFAMSTITAATNLVLYEIVVAPGRYTENFAIKPWVWVTGYDPMITIVQANSVTLDASFAGSGDKRSGFSNLYLRAPTVYTFDMVALASTEGKLYFNNVQTRALTFLSHNQINQYLFNGCQIWGNITITGGNSVLAYCNVMNGNDFTINGISNGDNHQTFFTTYGGASSGALTAVFTSQMPNTNNNAVNIALLSTPFYEGITLDGANNPSGGPSLPMLEATSDSIVQDITYLNSAPAPSLLTNALAVSYTPANPADWTVQPTTVQQALDMIAAHLNPVSTAVWAPPPASNSTWPVTNHDS